MRTLRIRSASEQVADFLREEIRRRTWTGAMPGEQWLVAHLQTGRNTVRAALDHLEAEGVLLQQGHGRCRMIAATGKVSPGVFRISLLLRSNEDRQDSIIHDAIHQLSKRGYEVDVAPRSLTELGMKVERVADMVKRVETEAWVVFAASLEVLDWFSAQPVPAFAMFGRFSRRGIAGIGPDRFPAYREALRRLYGLGHRRIVLLLPEQTRKPRPGRITQLILDEMETLGIKTGPYHLPDWEAHPAGLRLCLDRLFDLTPPTALIVDEAYQFLAVRHHLAERGIFAPKHVSLICCDDHPSFKWCEPSVSCIRWSSDPLVRRLVRWAGNVAGGKEDRRASFSKADFIEGGSIGPARKGR